MSGGGEHRFPCLFTLAGWKEATVSVTWEHALSSMRSALTILDESEAPMDIGAHLDLAIVRLEEAITVRDEKLAALGMDRTAVGTV